LTLRPVVADSIGELDRLLGDNVSYPKRVRGMIEVIKRERLIEKVRRKILGTEEILSGITRTLPEDESELVEPPRSG
jgi:hypothetical protein